MVWGVTVSVCIIVVQGETVRPRGTVIRVRDDEVDYLLANSAPGITIPFGPCTTYQYVV